MGNKVNPIGFRLAVQKDWRSKWYANKQEFPEFLHTDVKVRHYLKEKLRFAARLGHQAQQNLDQRGFTGSVGAE